MKRIVFSILLFVLTFFGAVLLTLYFQRDSHPTLVCRSVDGSEKSPRRCLLNPFRDRRAEKLAEEILSELKRGNYQAVTPYISHRPEDQIKHFLENEREHPLERWEIDSIGVTSIEMELTYRVSRKDSPNGRSASVSFLFTRPLDDGNGEWKLRYFSAIY